MSPFASAQRSSAPLEAVPRQARAAACPQTGTVAPSALRTQAFAMMQSAYRASGGLARGDDLARLMECLLRGNVASLARLIVAHDIFSFEWQGSTWIPMFQFELEDLSLRPAPRQVAAEFSGVFDGWTLAHWFVEPNGWLDMHRPLDLMAGDLPAVLNAARADRYVATG